jgi:hypothetical protein
MMRNAMLRYRDIFSLRFFLTWALVALALATGAAVHAAEEQGEPTDSADSFWGTKPRAEMHGPPQITVEALVARSPVIVRGRIDSGKEDSIFGSPPMPTLLHVTQVLKGSAAKELIYTPWSEGPVGGYNMAMGAAGDEFLCFLFEDAEQAGNDGPRTYECIYGFNLAHGGELGSNPGIWNFDLEPVRDCDDILRITRDELARNPRTPRTEILYAGEYSDYWGYEFVVVPSDERLVGNARQWAVSPRALTRCYAAATLVARGAPDAPLVLETMLHDDVYEQSRVFLSPWNVRKFPARMQAAALLSNMGRAVPVVGEEPANFYKPMPIWQAGAVVLAAAAAVFVYRRRRARLNLPRLSLGRLAGRGVGVLLLLAWIGLAVLWGRGARIADDWVFTSRGHLFDVTSYRGGLRCEVLRQWPLSTGPVHIAVAPHRTVACMRGTDDEGFWHEFGTEESQGPPGILWNAFRFEPHYFETRRPAEIPRPANAPPLVAADAFFPLPGAEPDLAASDAWLIVIPTRYAVLGGLPIPAFWIVSIALVAGRTARGMRRRRRGLCEGCGYDLRSTVLRCPECGRHVLRPVVGK